MARSAVASLSWLLETHRNGRIGSPIVAGSSNRSKSASSVGSFIVNRGLPPPLRRTFPVKDPGSHLQTATDRASGDLRRARGRGDPPVTRRLRLRGSAQSPASLVERGTNDFIPDAQR